MSRVIFSLYVDIPDENLVSHHESKQKFNDNYDWLLSKQQEYAKHIGVDYKHIVYDQDYVNYKDWFLSNYPEISEYNVVNFYKIHLMYEMAKQYDQILYLDFDVIPVTDINFFEQFNLSDSVAVMTGTAEAQKDVNEIDTLRYTHHFRSPMAKHWNTKCMLQEQGFATDGVEVFNTGIVGISKKYLDQLNYFDDFRVTLDFMTQLQNDEFYPDRFRQMFGYDNETIWGYKTFTNNVPFVTLDNGWHHFMDKWSYIPPSAKFVHCVSKDFDYVREWCEKNNI
jgi:hypothetical protein